MENDLMNMFMELDDENNDTNTGNPLTGGLTGMLPNMMPNILSSISGDPGIMQEVIKNIVKQYKPIVYTILQELFEVYKDLANNEEVFKAQAQMKSNAYKAYMETGFSSEQAMLFLLDSDITRKKILHQAVSTGIKMQID